MNNAVAVEAVVRVRRIEMEAHTYQIWSQLHLRVARGETLTAEEKAIYDIGIKELDREEKIEGDMARLRQLKANLAQLEAENTHLREERQQLDAQIAAVEAHLSQETRQELGIGAN
ncbi:MAG TPA: hypothetical protein VKU00_34650 [Chthonomonadaceae bacterium]|nr:hypothetical protein [Chthonomonadaceae bacterium]